MINIQVAEEIELAEELTGLNDELERAARTALELAGAEPAAGLTIVLTDDAQIQQLNSQFSGLDAPTDVLSFPAGELDLDSDELYLGDIVISAPRALAQASAGGHLYREEMQLLVVHGVLHLLGHDHGEPDEKQRMWALQSQALAALGCTISSPP
ncbi:MAG TPA: rRNA maturation RNase YbeY [Anaerolineales bacterium]|nr:rRNA maturation RNase YbeY [Anaerolineales bacterium]